MMQTKTFLRTNAGTRILALALAAAGTAAMTGCGAGTFASATGPVTAAVALSGHILGGQQPVTGAIIQLYAAGQTGYGVGSTPLIASPVSSDANGNFSITGTYTCPYPTSQVYVTATGGNPGGVGNNANLVLMAALGPCGNLSASSFAVVNELTTVASAYALSPFMSSPTQLSTTPTNLTGLNNAVSTVSKLVSIGKGLMPGDALPAGATEPIAELNTLADILAGCVNSNGVGGTSTSCASLFTNATPPGGTAPTDTVTAILDIAKNPANNASALFLSTPPNPPFQPTLTSAPAAYTVSLRYVPTGPGAFSNPTASASDVAGNLWVTNAGNNTISLVGAATGVPLLLTGGSLNSPSSIAFDMGGNAWVPNQGGSSLSVFTPSGAGTLALSGNFSNPTGVAIDGQGLIWVSNSGNNTVTQVTTSGTTVTAAKSYQTGGITPSAIAINPN